MESNKVLNETFYNISAVINDLGKYAFKNNRTFPGFDIMPFLSGENFQTYVNGQWVFSDIDSHG